MQVIWINLLYYTERYKHLKIKNIFGFSQKISIRGNFKNFSHYHTRKFLDDENRTEKGGRKNQKIIFLLKFCKAPEQFIQGLSASPSYNIQAQFF